MATSGTMNVVILINVVVQLVLAFAILGPSLAAMLTNAMIGLTDLALAAAHIVGATVKRGYGWLVTW